MSLYQSSQKLRRDGALSEITKDPTLKAKALANLGVVTAGGNIGAATGTSLAVTGALTSSGTAGVGYATGAGGAVTQATSRTTGVTLNKICGIITTNNASLAAGATATFTVTNSTVAITDVPRLAIRSGATTDQTTVGVTGVAAGSFNITVKNGHASTAETGAIIVNFLINKAVSS